MTRVIVILFIIMNLIGFFVCYKDKRAAVKDKWRVREKTLFILGFLWGGLGVFAAMLTFRHKTKHWYFMVGMPVLIVINCLTLYWAVKLIGLM